MVYGPHRKSGFLADTTIQHGQTKIETFEIKFPYENIAKEGKDMRGIKTKGMDLTIQLWHLPTGGDYPKGQVGKDKYIL